MIETMRLFSTHGRDIQILLFCHKYPLNVLEQCRLMYKCLIKVFLRRKIFDIIKAPQIPLFLNHIK